MFSALIYLLYSDTKYSEINPISQIDNLCVVWDHQSVEYKFENETGNYFSAFVLYSLSKMVNLGILSEQLSSTRQYNSFSVKECLGFIVFIILNWTAQVTMEGAEKLHPELNTQMQLHLGQILYNLVKGNNYVWGTKLRMESHTKLRMENPK